MFNSYFKNKLWREWAPYGTDENHPLKDELIDYALKVIELKGHGNLADIKENYNSLKNYYNFAELSYEDQWELVFEESPFYQEFGDEIYGELSGFNQVPEELLLDLMQIGLRQPSWLIYGHGPVSPFSLVRVLKNKGYEIPSTISRKWLHKQLKKLNKSIVEESDLCPAVVHHEALDSVEASGLTWNLLKREEDYKLLGDRFKNCTWWNHWINREKNKNLRIYWAEENGVYHLAAVDPTKATPFEDYELSLEHGANISIEDVRSDKADPARELKQRLHEIKWARRIRLKELTKLASGKKTGWKIVSWDGEKLRSLADSSLIYDIKEGDVVSNPEGFYLGTSKEFVQDYYSDTTDYSDALISFEYDKSDIISGSPDEEGEVKVLKAKVSDIEILNDFAYKLSALLNYLNINGLIKEAKKVSDIISFAKDNEPSSNEELYHGTLVGNLEKLEPRPAGVLDGESAVFTTPERWMAVSNIGIWGDSDIDQGTINGENYMIEQYPGAFKKVYSSPGWLYTVSSDGFEKDSRLMDAERISKKEVQIIKSEKIEDPLKEMESLGVNLITADKAEEHYRANEYSPK